MEKNKFWTTPSVGEQPPRVRRKEINRQQLLLRPVEVEKLVEEDHPVRAIWEMVGRLDLEPFYTNIEAVEGVAGRPVWDPQLLISLWLYAYKEGVSSAREIARLCEYHPAYQWLTGLEVVNYHTLADFRIRHKEALDQLFIEVLGVLSHEGLITLQRVMHDGTKVKACASDKSFRRKATLQDHLRLAREQVEQMGDPESEELSQRLAKARQRALREKRERLEEALKVLEQMEASRSKSSDKTKVRASTTDPEARVMLQAKGAYGPSYNVQISTDAEAKIIVGVGVTQSPTDAAELEPAVERIEANLGEKPKQMVVDGGLTNQATMEAMAEKQVDLIGALPERRGGAENRMKQRGVSPEFYPQAFEYDASADCYRCPAGKGLLYETEERSGASVRRRYRAKVSDCRGCAFQAQCCPGTKRGRSVVRSEATPEMAAFQVKMETPEAQAIYKQRAGVAEFPNAWIKDKIKLRQFRLRGLVKVTLEAVWACLTYNICQWIRLCWKPQQLAQA
jgi:transposase/Zn-finger protein